MESVTASNSQASKTWLGSSIPDICKGKGPWSFAISPVSASKYHAVLYNLPITLKSPPKPHQNSYSYWDEDHVRLPFSEKNLFPVVEDGVDVIKLRWNIITQSLSEPIENSRELEKAILRYNNLLPKFLALHYFFEEVLEEEEAVYFFKNLLPKIITLALQLPDLVPGSFPLLKKYHNRSVSISQQQIACLLANAFLCTFPWKKDVANSYPGVNFVRLFQAHARPKRQSSVAEKLKCICHYFRRVTDQMPVGAITFERKFIPRGSMPRWDESDNNLGNTKIHIDSSGTIEDDGLGFLQVDFANKNVGGGVLGYGCVQEEIRFVICPELIISRLFVEQLGDHEAVTVIGAERYSKYTGYGDLFSWSGDLKDETPFDEYGRRRTTICIIDATRFNKPRDQFYPSAMLRELNKAYVGFSSREKDNLAPVATGNWGCGAFRGSSNLKSLIQLMACSIARRDLVYYSFGDEDLRDEFYNLHLFLANNKITISQLWRFVCGFSTSGLSQDRFYAYIQQAYFDSKNQPTIKAFFGKNTRKKENDVPSTSFYSSEKRNPSQNGLKVNEEPKKKTCLNKDSVEINMEGIDCFDEDIIPPTPPEQLLRKQTKIRPKISIEETIKKLPKTDIAELIDIIDGNAIKPQERNKQESFFTEIDKLRKKSKTLDFEEHEHIKTEANRDKMDVDNSLNSDSIDNILLSPSIENSSSKRKITDYFQIKPSRSS